MTNLTTGVLLAFCFFCGLGLGELWGIDKRISTREKRAFDYLSAIDKTRIQYLRKFKLMNDQIKGFKKAGGELLSLTIKSLDSIDKSKLRTIRRFRSLLTWAEKYLA